MNLFNRLILILLCLALIAAAGAVIGLAWAAPDESIDWLADAATWLEDHNTDGTRILITIGGAIVALIGLIVVIAELKPRRKAEVKVTGLQSGDAVLTTAAIGQRIEEVVGQVPNVSDVRAVVQAKGKGVLVNLDLHVDPEANLAAVTDEACEAARDVLTDKVHVQLLAPPRARLHYRDLRLQGRNQRRATPAPLLTPVAAGVGTLEPAAATPAGTPTAAAIDLPPSLDTVTAEDAPPPAAETLVVEAVEAVDEEARAVADAVEEEVQAVADAPPEEEASPQGDDEPDAETPARAGRRARA